MFTNSKVTLALALFSTIILAVVIGMVLYFIRSQGKEIAGLIARTDQVDQDASLYQSIRTLENSAQGDLDVLDDVALDDKKLVSVIEDIENAARALKLKIEINSVERSQGSSAADPQPIRISLTAEGSWQGVDSLLRAIEVLPHRTTFESVGLEKSSGIWESNIIFSLYSFNQ